MKRIIVPLGIFIGSLLFSSTTIAQNKDSDLYQADTRFTDSLLQRVESVMARENIKKVPVLKEKAWKLKDNIGTRISNLPKKETTTLSDEALFEKRKKSVLLIGKFAQSEWYTKPMATIFATGFVITDDGVCVTNYHVLAEILTPPGKNSDQPAWDSSAYFVETIDGAIYMIDNVLAYSKSNDVAVFHINLRGNKLTPIPLGDPAKVGAAVYVISHPDNNFYYYTKGMVAKNYKAIDTLNNNQYKYRMGITADYAVGSSGGPIIDQYGNLAGVVSSTFSIYGDEGTRGRIQMVLKNAIPVWALRNLLQ